MWHAWETGEVYMWLLLGDVKEREHSEDLDVHGRMKLKYIFKKWDGDEWIGLIWLSIGTGDGRL